MASVSCGVCGEPVDTNLLVDHIDKEHPDALRHVREYAISGPGEQVTVDRRHLERAPGETELMWLVRMACNLGYCTSNDIGPHGFGCCDCHVPFAPGFRLIQRLVSMTDDGTPVVEIVCYPCAQKSGDA
jgi:hypothetical protein